MAILGSGSSYHLVPCRPTGVLSVILVWQLQQDKKRHTDLGSAHNKIHLSVRSMPYCSSRRINNKKNAYPCHMIDAKITAPGFYSAQLAWSQHDIQDVVSFIG